MSSIFAKVLGGLATGAAHSLNTKYANETAERNARTGARRGGGSDCSPCKARALQHQVQQSLGVKGGWYKV